MYMSMHQRRRYQPVGSFCVSGRINRFVIDLHRAELVVQVSSALARQALGCQCAAHRVTVVFRPQRCSSAHSRVPATRRHVINLVVGTTKNNTCSAGPDVHGSSPKQTTLT